MDQLSLRRLQGHDHLHGFKFLGVARDEVERTLVRPRFSCYFLPFLDSTNFQPPKIHQNPLSPCPRRHKGVSLGNLSALLVQVAHHLAVHVRAQLGGVVDVGDHDGLGPNDQAQAQRLANHEKEAKEAKELQVDKADYIDSTPSQFSP